MHHDIQRNYTRVFAVYSLIVASLLYQDILNLQHNPETWHKVFHLFLGIILIKWGWNKTQFCKPFSLFSGLLFLFLGLFGFTYPDFASQTGLQAFSTTYTFIHILIGLSGIGAYFTDRIKF